MTKQQPARRGMGTVGEKIVISVFGGPLHGVREYQSGEYANRRTAARRIDSALRRAVKEAWDACKEYQREVYEGCDGAPTDVVERISTKYGIKL